MENVKEFESMVGSYFSSEIVLSEEQITDKYDKYEYEVHIYDGEGAIPHCHVKTTDHDNKKELCICLHSNNYFDHNEKFRTNTKKWKFNSRERKDFDNWARSKYISKEERKKEKEEIENKRKELSKEEFKKFKTEYDKKKKEESKSPVPIKDTNWAHMIKRFEELNKECKFPENKKSKSIPMYTDLYNYKSN